MRDYNLQMDWDIVLFVHLGCYLVSNPRKRDFATFLSDIEMFQVARDGVYEKACSTLAPYKSVIFGFSLFFF